MLKIINSIIEGIIDFIDYVIDFITYIFDLYWMFTDLIPSPFKEIFIALEIVFLIKFAIVIRGVIKK